MKSAALRVIFTTTLGIVLPHVYASNPTCDSSNINTTIESKLPWVTSTGSDDDYVKCLDISRRMYEESPPSGETVNEVCGTEDFCEAFDPEIASAYGSKKLTEVYGFASVQECFDAHEQNPAASSQDAKPNAKLPWVTFTSAEYGKCLDIERRMSEESPPSGDKVNEVCGTKNFCENFGPEYVSEDGLKRLTEVYGFASVQECFDAHEEEPTA